MTSLRFTICLVLVTSPLAGCLDTLPGHAEGEEDGEYMPPAIHPDPTVVLPHVDRSGNHDHANISHHERDWNIPGWNLPTIAWTPHAEDATQVGTYGQVDVYDGVAFVAAQEIPPTMQAGVIVVDLETMETAATWTSDLLSPTALHVGEHGDLVVVAGPQQRDARVSAADTRAGVHVLDVSDPTEPEEVARWRSRLSGLAAAEVTEIGGETYVFAASPGAASADHAGSAVEILRLDKTVPDGLVHEGRFVPQEPPSRDVFVADLRVQEHPITGEMLLYVAYGDGGLVVADVGEPVAPRQISQWDAFDRSETGDLRSVKPLPVLVDDRHVTVLTPTASDAKGRKSYAVDTTDPGQARKLGWWQLPADQHGALFSPHRFDVARDGLMAIGHRHAGVWLVDLAPLVSGDERGVTIGWRAPFPPLEDRGPLVGGNPVPDVLDVAFTEEGRLAVSDAGTGFYLMGIGERDPGVPPYE